MPILVSAAFVWIASALMHMVFPHHKSEWKGLPDEAKFNDALAGVPAGQYMFPWCGGMDHMKDPDYLAKVAKGPNGTLTIWAAPVNMGKNLLLTLLFYVLVGVFVAYLAWYSMGKGPHDYMHIFRIAGTAAFMAHGLGWMSHAIWYG